MNSFIEKHSDKIITLSDCGCMIWMGALTPKGYGQAQFGDKTSNGRARPSYTHRAVMAAAGVPIVGMVVRHRCDVPCCVNPDHLVIGSCHDNSLDMVGRGRSLKGSRQPNALMIESDISEIRARHARGEATASIAKDFPVHVETVRKAVHAKTWRHVQ